jgi:hypothetical protein
MCQKETKRDLRLRKVIDYQYLKTPYYDRRRRMRLVLQGQAHHVNEKKTMHLVQLIGYQGNGVCSPYKQEASCPQGISLFAWQD